MSPGARAKASSLAMRLLRTPNRTGFGDWWQLQDFESMLELDLKGWGFRV